MALETGITLTVYADQDYSYDVKVNASTISVNYVESRLTRDRDTELRFGSLEEMEAVAKAMLKAVKLAEGN